MDDWWCGCVGSCGDYGFVVKINIAGGVLVFPWLNWLN